MLIDPSDACCGEDEWHVVEHNVLARGRPRRIREALVFGDRATGPEFSLFAIPLYNGLNLAPLDPVATVPPALYGSSNGAVNSDHARASRRCWR